MGGENNETSQHGIEPVANNGNILPDYRIRKRQISESSESTSSSLSSFGIDNRNTGLFFCKSDEDIGYRLEQALSKKVSLHTVVSIPAGKHFLEGLIKIGRRVELNVFLVTENFVAKHREYECMLQSRVCRRSNTVLLVDEQIKLPHAWRHFPKIFIQSKHFDAQAVCQDVLNFKLGGLEPLDSGSTDYDSRTSTTIIGHKKCDKFVVISDVLCYISSYLPTLSKPFMKSVLSNHHPITKEMLIQALCYLHDHKINQMPSNEDSELKSKLENDRDGLLDEIFDAFQRLLSSPTQVKFVASDISLLPSTCICTDNYQSKYPEQLEASTKKGHCENISVAKQKATLELEEPSIVIPIVKTGNGVDGSLQQSIGTLAPIWEESKKVQHFLVKGLPPGWKLENAANCLEGYSQSLRSITRMSRLKDNATSFKIAITESIATIRNLDTWPRGAKIVRFYFWQQNHFSS